jgi:rhodanese-related sulfurtransferase
MLFIFGEGHYSVTHWSIKEHSPRHGFIDGVLLLDVRSSEDYERSHIPGAISLDPRDWDSAFPVFLERWSPERTVVIYCGGQSCGVSKEVALRLLTDLPDAAIYVLKGGFPAWNAYQPKAKISS